MRSENMARHDPQMNVRIPENLLNEVKKEAGDQRRTMTAQINLIIEEWLDSKKQQDAKA
ncbi:Arc family DNA-binding protein [Acinetobacter baumannii]|nr:Arc family DNA-binding protein [Acinetobacter baumannii]